MIILFGKKHLFFRPLPIYIYTSIYIYMGAGLLFFNFSLLSQLHGSDFARAIYYLLCNPYIQVMFEVLSTLIYM